MAKTSVFQNHDTFKDAPGGATAKWVSLEAGQRRFTTRNANDNPDRFVAGSGSTTESGDVHLFCGTALLPQTVPSPLGDTLGGVRWVAAPDVSGAVEIEGWACNKLQAQKASVTIRAHSAAGTILELEAALATDAGFGFSASLALPEGHEWEDFAMLTLYADGDAQQIASPAGLRQFA